MKGHCRHQKTQGVGENQIVDNQDQSDGNPSEVCRQVHPPNQHQGHHKAESRGDHFVAEKLAQIVFEKTHRSHDQTVDRAVLDFLNHPGFVHPIRRDPGDESRPKDIRQIIFAREAGHGFGLGSGKNRNPQSEFDQPRGQRLQNRVSDEIEAILKIGQNGEAKEREIPSPKTGE